MDSIPASYPECEKGLEPMAAIHNHHFNFWHTDKNLDFLLIIMNFCLLYFCFYDKKAKCILIFYIGIAPGYHFAPFSSFNILVGAPYLSLHSNSLVPFSSKEMVFIYMILGVKSTIAILIILFMYNNYTCNCQLNIIPNSLIISLKQH